MSDLVLVKKFQNTVEAQIAKNFLEQEGIHAAVSAADSGGTISGFAGWLVGEGALFVLESDVDNARTLLKAAEHNKAVADKEDRDE